MNPPPAANRTASTDQALGLLVEELTARLQAGEVVDVDAYVQAHPEHAERLRQLLPALHLLAELGHSAASGVPSALPLAAPGDGLSGTLGDFRIIREVGRGGMGVVYEAEQISLGRTVALKVLPFAAALDGRQLQRFKNEAQAAAHLQHQHIVPVYGVGSERGVHYYAMQFIDGHSLAELIQQLRRGEPRGVSPEATGPYTPPSGGDGPIAATPPVAGLSTECSTRSPAFFQAMARLGGQAALALEHAHSLGVVHRDIKPANLLLDARTNLWITDFGLAQVQSDTRLTMTGDLVGTLRYMSPEQALGQRGGVDHRSDLYSLGATLYELLTLEPAFAGRDRQELLRQIAFEEPRPPRRWNQAIPVELETIVLKALAKSPTERYGTAQELADDLERFLKDEPIRARRPTVVQKVRRWARRHRAVVATALVGLLVAVAVLAGSVGWALRDRRAREDKGASAANEALREASAWQQRRKWYEALTAARRAEGVLSSTGGNAELWGEVRERVKDLEMLERLEYIRIEQNVLRDNFIDHVDADPAYTAAFQRYGIDVERLPPREAAELIRARAIRVELAGALDFWVMTRKAGGDARGKHLLAIVQAADPEDGWHNRLRDALQRRDRKALVLKLAASADVGRLPIANLHLLGEILIQAGAAQEASDLLGKAQERHPSDFWINHYLASSFARRKPPQWDEALRFYTVAVALRSHNSSAHYNQGVALQHTGRLDGAIAAYREAIHRKPDDADAHNNLGLAFKNKGQLARAIGEYQKAIDIKPDFAMAHNNLGNALYDRGQLDEAIACFRKALRLKKDFAGFHYNLGNALERLGKGDEAIAEFRTAIRLEPGLALAHYSLGNALQARGKLNEAIAEFRTAIRLEPGRAQTHYNLGNALQASGKLNEAVACYRQAIKVDPRYAEAHHNLGNALYARGKEDEAIACYRTAIGLGPKLFLTHTALGIALQARGQVDEAIHRFRKAIEINPQYAQAHASLGLALLDRGRYAEARVASARALRLLPVRHPQRPLFSQQLHSCEQMVALEQKLPQVLRGDRQPASVEERLRLGQMCQHKQFHVAAARFYAEAFAAEPSLADHLDAGHRYNAACAAAQAGCGQGKDADKANDQERACLWQQALGWLEADLTLWTRLAEKDNAALRQQVARTLRHWQQDADLAGVRARGALDRLPEAERKRWQKLWAAVAQTLRNSQGQPPANKPEETGIQAPRKPANP
jgi:tetratricopeptide (TPR) repeat protein